MKTKNRALFAAITVFTCIFMILSNAVAIIKDVAISKTFSETDFTHALLALVYLALAIAVGTNSRKAFPVVCLAIPIHVALFYDNLFIFGKHIGLSRSHAHIDI